MQSEQEQTPRKMPLGHSRHVYISRFLRLNHRGHEHYLSARRGAALVLISGSTRAGLRGWRLVAFSFWLDKSAALLAVLLSTAGSENNVGHLLSSISFKHTTAN